MSQQRLILPIAILASFVAFLDGSVVNVALPAIERELGGGLSLQQWVVDAYLITLGALMLLAGSMSDQWGRRRILAAGLIGFGAASLACAVAPSGTWLVAARAVQGAAGSLLVPSSLAMIIAAYKGTEQAAAIGRWTAWTSAAFLVGPLVGGALVDAGSWRWVFGINVIPIAITLWLVSRTKVPEMAQTHRLDWAGALMGAGGLGAVTVALVEGPRAGWPGWAVLALGAGVLTLAALIWHERRTAEPMLPLRMFGQNNFTVGNVATLAIYAGLGGSTLLLALYLQELEGLSALATGLALLPVTIIMSLFSGKVGSLAGRLGQRWFMTTGPAVMAAGLAWAAFMATGLVAVLPAIGLLGIGLVLTVAPLTGAVLGDVAPAQAGIASAINNAAARIAGLLGVAAIGLFGAGAELTRAGFQSAMLLMCGLMITGAVVSALGIRSRDTASDRL